MGGFGAWLRGLLGRKPEPAPDHHASHPRTPPGGPGSLAEDNDFALTLYQQLRQRPGNLFFSPFSVRTALVMALAGAKGETARQMGRALRLPSEDPTPHGAHAEAIRSLTATRGDGDEVVVANSLWSQEGVPLQTGFVDLIGRHYGGGMHLVDFRRDAEAARVSINHWVEDETRQRIRDLMPSGAVQADTRLVLVNAAYFRGTWLEPFHEAATRDEPFRLEGGLTAQAPLMHQQNRIPYLLGEGYQAVDLAYRAGNLSMLVLLPDRDDGLRDLEATLSATMLHDCVARMEVREVNLSLPRFTVTWGSIDLREQLATLGMPLAFDRLQADFSGINGQEPPSADALYLSAVFHKAFAEVNEEGTVAAAATAAGMPMIGAARPAPLPVPIFRADHPFTFAIRDRRSGAILFLGRLVDPR